MSEAPERACRFRLDLQGDSRDEVCAALRHIEYLIATSQITTGVSGGCGSGYAYEYRENQGPSHDEYFEQLTRYLETRRGQSTVSPQDQVIQGEGK